MDSMKRILKRLSLRSVLAVGLIAMVVAIWIGADDRESRTLADRPWSPEECTAYLVDPDPLVRSYAIDDLLLAGEASMECLQRGARSEDEQMRNACMEMLTEFLYSEDGAVCGAGVDALMELREESPVIAADARRRLVTHQDQIAMSCRRELGTSGAFLQLSPVIGGNRNSTVTVAIVLGPRWQGGRAGLEWIRRMPRSPRLYLVDGDEIAMDDLDWLRTVRADLVIQRRGRACLGVTFLEGLRVHAVVPDSPADAAGIRPLSLLVDFDGVAVETFEDSDQCDDRSPTGRIGGTHIAPFGKNRGRIDSPGDRYRNRRMPMRGTGKCLERSSRCRSLEVNWIAGACRRNCHSL